MAKDKKHKKKEEEEPSNNNEQLGEKNKESVQESDAINVKIELVPENPGKISPVIGYFPSGYDPLKNKGKEPEPDVKLYRSNKRPNRMQLVVSPNDSPVNFVGTSYYGEAAAPRLCNYGLGILDKSTNTLKIVPIAGNRIFRLEPRIGGSGDEIVQTVKHEQTAEEKAAKERELTLMYSSKKNIRKVKKLDSLRQSQDPETEKNLESKFAHIEISKDALEVAEMTRDVQNIPPYDMDATIPEKAYPLNKIIFDGEWNFLSDIEELLKAGKEVEPDVYPSFVCSRAYKLDNVEDEKEKSKLAGIFSFITHLIKFKDRHSMDGVSSAKYHKIPGILHQRFSSLFALSESNRIPDDQRKLLINYILVLTLYIDDFRTNFSDIAKDLKMNEMALRPFFDSLGCKLVRENQMTLATLPLPLKFPTASRKRRR